MALHTGMVDCTGKYGSPTKTPEPSNSILEIMPIVTGGITKKGKEGGEDRTTRIGAQEAWSYC